MFHNFH